MSRDQGRSGNCYPHEAQAGPGRWLLAFTILLVMTLGGCGGTKILDKPVPVKIEKPLASASDDNIRVNLDWVIVRDGPGSWAKKADWDEYLITVKNAGERPMEITGVAVYDSTGYRLQSSDDRKKLIKRSKETERRYLDLGISLEAGWGSAGTTILVGSAVTVGGVATAVESAYVGSTATTTAGAAAGLLIGPAIVTIGVVQVVRNKKVAREIRHRRTRLPLLLAPQNAVTLDLFFPLAPSPRQLVLDYRIGGDDYRLDVNTESALWGLHIHPELPDK